MVKCVSVLGSTGSVGRQSLDIISRMPDVKVSALTAGSSVELMAQQCRQFLPRLAVMATEEAAEKLKTARTMQVDLRSQSEATFDGTSNIRLGVTGILPSANGGTGNTAGIAPSATKLATAQNIWVDLESILTTESFDGTKAVHLGVLGVLPIISGGTGARAAKGAAYNLFGDETNMSESTTDVKDDNLIVFRYTNPSSENGVFTYKKASTIWTWLQSKLSSSNLKVNTLTLGSTAGEAGV